MVIRDDRHARLQGIGLAVQGQEALALNRRPHHQIALHLGRVEHMQRAVQVEGEKVGDVDQHRNRPQADRLEPLLQPGGRGAVLDAANDTAKEMRAGLVRHLRRQRRADGRREGARHLDRGKRFQLTQTPRRKVARHTAHTQRIGAVWGDLDVEHRVDHAGVVHRQPVGEPLANLARGQLDDAVMLVRQLQLAFRTHHAVGFDTADLANAQRHVDAGHIIAGLRQNHGDPGPRIGCAADDLLFALIRHHAADAQPVGIGVLRRLDHAGQREGGQSRGGVDDLLNLQPQIGQGIGDLVHRGGGVEVILEPREREFHRSGLPVSAMGGSEGGLARNAAKGKRGRRDRMGR